MMVSDTELLISKLEKVMYDEFEINHVTLQFECDRCESAGLIN